MKHILRHHAALPLRLILGSGFLFHGYGKLFPPGGHDGFAAMLQELGIPAANLTAWLVGVVEFGGGLALLFGAFVGVVATLQIAIMLVALFTVHLDAGFNFMNVVGVTEGGPQFGMPGFEVNLLYIGGLVTLLLAGPGPLSLAGFIATRRRRAGERLARTGETPISAHA